MQLLWAKDMYDRLVADELAKNVAEADKLLELHQERKVLFQRVLGRRRRGSGRRGGRRGEGRRKGRGGERRGG